MKLPDAKVERLLKKHRIPIPRQGFARDEEGAVKACRSVGYPVAMKASSHRIIHKTDVGGLVLGIRDEAGARKAYRRIVKRTKVRDVLIQEHVSGTEVIVGSKHDETFGPVMMFGLGGIFVEVMKDVSFRLIPIQRKDAKEMIREIRAYPVLAGIRGKKPISFRALEDVMLKVSTMVRKEGIREMDINPLFVSHKGAVAADVRILA
jgi:acyl-CoA synthetase (NDP forming)